MLKALKQTLNTLFAPQLYNLDIVENPHASVFQA